jgi:single-strand DNA-binding protein
MNLSILCGNLCKPIELKCTPSGKYVIQNTIAVRNDFKNKDGNYDSTFINIVVWGNQAEYLSKYAGKGSKVLVEGRISNRSYDKQDGSKAYVTEVVVEKAEILTYKKEENETPVEQPKEEPAVVLSDEDLPF